MENDIDEAFLIKNNLAYNVDIYKDLLDTLLNTFSEL